MQNPVKLKLIKRYYLTNDQYFEFVKELEKNDFQDIKITSTPTDVSALSLIHI